VIVPNKVWIFLLVAIGDLPRCGNLGFLLCGIETELERISGSLFAAPEEALGSAASASEITETADANVTASTHGIRLKKSRLLVGYFCSETRRLGMSAAALFCLSPALHGSTSLIG
jgi:hypothetical protein